MAVIYDLYMDKNSFLHRLDPRVKFASIIIGMIISFIFSNIFWILAYYICLIMILLSAKVGWGKYLYAVKLMLPITILVIILWPIFYPGGEPVLFQLGPLRISLPSLIDGIVLALRLNCLALLTYIFLYTTTQRALVRGLVKLGFPYKYGVMLSFSLRYVPTFGAIIAMIVEAQKARGLELDKGNFFSKLKKYVAVMAPTIITALRMADNLAIALDSRAFDAPVKRTYLVDLKAGREDVIILLLTIFVFSFVLFIRFKYQMGI
ncbi:energy-coupling factor transporter transmembrane protein EcfT [Candidatus Aerophobetes bacterium]|nr:energy-coupling factor transporter transmembrane protein EcfT [Candidatus Aerophobetes bacterium]